MSTKVHDFDVALICSVNSCFHHPPILKCYKDGRTHTRVRETTKFFNSTLEKTYE